MSRTIIDYIKEKRRKLDNTEYHYFADRERANLIIRFIDELLEKYDISEEKTTQEETKERT